MGSSVNGRYKDRLFRFIFGESKENALSLYNAVNGSSHSNAEDLEFTTIENFIFMGMKNDISFLFNMEMNLFEHQSSPNPNMPLCGLGYLARGLEAYVQQKRYNIYGAKRIPLPTPRYVVFYNGEADRPDVQEQRLSEAFASPGGCLEVVATVYNINLGHNRELLESCSLLREYAALIARVRDYRASGVDTEQAVRKAVDDCIRNGILADILAKHKAEVIGMLFTEYNEAETMDMIREESFEEGREEGREETLVRTIRSLMQKMKWTAEQSMEALDIPMDKRTFYKQLAASAE